MTRHRDELVDVFLADLGAASPPAGLAASVGNRLRSERRPRPSSVSPWLAAAALLALLALASFAWIVGGPGPSPAPLPSAPASPSAGPSASPGESPSSSPAGSPSVAAEWDIALQPDPSGPPMSLHVEDDSGRVSLAAQAERMPAVAGSDVLAFERGADPRTLLVAWTGSICDERGVLTIAQDASTITLALPQPVGCDALGVEFSVALTLTFPVDPAAFSGLIRHDLVRIEDVTPTSVAFATPDHGWVGGMSNGGDAIVLETRDGGATWQVERLGSGQVTDVAVTGDGVAWAGRECVEAAPTCHPGLYRQDDSGLWAQVGQDWPATLSFAGNAGAGLFLAADSPVSQTGMPVPEIRLTDDGGDSWRASQSPCGSLNLVDAVRATAGEVLVLCTTEGGTGAEVKRLYRSEDTGGSWQLVASTDDGSMRTAGTGVRIDISGDGTGWLWGARTPLLATSDGGATWTALDVADGDVRIVTGADASGDGGGTILVWDPDRNATLLLTTDDGRAWTERSLFPPAVRCCG